MTSPLVQTLVDHPYLTIGGFAVSMWLSLGVVVIFAVEIAMLRRVREIKAMFRSALNVSKSYELEVAGLRAERKKDRALIDDEIVPNLAKVMDKQIEHGTRLDTQERRLTEVERFMEWLRSRVGAPKEGP